LDAFDHLIPSNQRNRSQNNKRDHFSFHLDLSFDAATFLLIQRFSEPVSATDD